MLPPYPSNEPMEFCGRIVGDLVRSKLAAPRHHLMGSKPDTQVHELNKPAAVCPPHEAKLLDDEQTKPSVGLFRCAFRIRSCNHVASLVWRGQGLGVRCSREGSADFGTHVPCEAHNLGLTAGQS
jgi:hypothetical protein